MWHLQPTRVTARCFTAGGSYENRDSPQVIAQVDLRSDGTAFIHAAMSRDGVAITPALWRELARVLHRQGVTRIEWEHKGRHADVATDRALP